MLLFCPMRKKIKIHNHTHSHSYWIYTYYTSVQTALFLGRDYHIKPPDFIPSQASGQPSSSLIRTETTGIIEMASFTPPLISHFKTDFCSACNSIKSKVNMVISPLLVLGHSSLKHEGKLELNTISISQ